MINVHSLLTPIEQQELLDEHRKSLNVSLRDRLTQYVMYGFGGSAVFSSLAVFVEGVSENDPKRIIGGIIAGVFSAVAGKVLGDHEEDKTRYELARTEEGRETLAEMINDKYSYRIEAYNDKADHLERITLETYDKMGISPSNPDWN